MDNDIGATQWRTCFSSVTRHGHRLDKIKSALQKYLRRRELEKMLWCAAEIYDFHRLARTDAEHRAARGIVTNLVNRIIVMMDEELLFADWGVYLQCRKWLREFEQGERSDFELIVRTCQALCGARLHRLNSAIRAYWMRGAGAAIGKAFGERVEAEGLGGAPEAAEDRSWLDAGGRHALRAFRHALDTSSPAAYYWALCLMAQKGVGKTRWRRTEPVYVVWEILFGRSLFNLRLRACLQGKLQEFHKRTRSERHMWLSAAISLCMYADRIDWSDKALVENPALRAQTSAPVKESILEFLETRGQMEIDDYAIDQHCAEGRRLGRGRQHFLTEGGKVMRPDKEYSPSGASSRVAE